MRDCPARCFLVVAIHNIDIGHYEAARIWGLSAIRQLWAMQLMTESIICVYVYSDLNLENIMDHCPARVSFLQAIEQLDNGKIEAAKCFGTVGVNACDAIMLNGLAKKKVAVEAAVIAPVVAPVIEKKINVWPWIVGGGFFCLVVASFLMTR
jgi:hypothetical protein